MTAQPPSTNQVEPALAPGNTPVGDDWVAARRALLQAQEIDLGDLPQGRLGIAFSGGGIRSATISLGVAQALAERDRLLDFDYMSTVSGGGYFGSFLRSLFLPQAARGSDARIAASTRADTDFAIEVLKSQPDSTTISNGMINPIRWLRENSRYLAPSGPTDYAVAATYILRNWLAMLFVFALPTLMAFLLIHGAMQGLAQIDAALNGGAWTPISGWPPVSILIVAPLLLAACSIVVGVANWLTVMTADPAATTGAKAKFTPAALVRRAATFVLVAGLVLFVIVGVIVGVIGGAIGGVIGGVIGGAVPPAKSGASLKILLAAVALFAAAAATAAVVAMTATARAVRRDPPIGDALFGNEVRRALTAFNAKLNIWLIVLLVLALIDSLALLLLQRVTHPGGVLAILTLLAPLGRALIQKLQASFGKSSPGGGFGAFLARYLWQVAFVMAGLLWGGFAVLLDVLVRAVSYAPEGWLPGWVLSFGIVAVAMAMVGKSVGFINLSSLHSLYAARLTRAFLGASNQDRLADPAYSDITGYQAKDVISAQVYHQQPCAAPLHLMNVTLNETISPTGSQMLERDRKGIPMVIAPEGIWIDAAEAKSTAATCNWAAFDACNAESFSIGQLTAISGAAASSAMGSRTTLGGAMLFTYANIRLGYWWNRGSIRFGGGPASPVGLRHGWEWTGTFGYLYREMTARYRSTTARVNLSDGGHFEDSGVYELLRRKVPTIVHCDNGEDVGYHFDDLEILVRKARLDVGVGLEVFTPTEVLAAVGIGGAGIFLNGKPGDWRARARSRDPSDPAFALLLKVLDADCHKIGTIVLLKPSLFCALPADVWGYAEQHPDFPHETTADQFFTEAQWESYRKLGFMMMQQLLVASPFKADLFRKL